MKKLLSFMLISFICVSMLIVPNVVKAASLDAEEIFKTWVNFPGEHLGSGYAAGWSYVKESDELRTTANVGFTGYYDPYIRNFTTGKFTCDILNKDSDPLGFVWGLKKGSKNGQDTYSFYEYEECGDNMWSISYVSEWIPAKDSGSHRGPVYHGTISAGDGQYHHNGGNGSIGFATGNVLAYGSLPADGLKGVKHKVIIEVEKSKVKVYINNKLLKEVAATVQGGSFGPCTASNSNAHFSGLTMEAAADNAAISAGFNYKLDGQIVNVAKVGDDVQVEDTSKVESPATIIKREWIVTLDGNEIYRGSTPYKDYGKKAGKYETTLNIESSQGITATTKGILHVINESNSVVAMYVDENGKKISEDIVYKGEKGDKYKTSSLEIKGYELVKVEGKEEGVFDNTPQVVEYIYRPVKEEVVENGTVTAKYVDESNNPIHNDIVYTGHVGDDYATSELIIPGYELLRVDGNKEGKYIKGDITVTYVYKKISPLPDDKTAGSVVVSYKDTNGLTIKEDTILNGNIGDAFKTTKVDIPGYKLVKTEGKEEGVFEENVQEVVYIYEPLDAEDGSSVVARYVDENGNTLKNDIILNGDLGDDYETHKENISGYILIRVEGEEKGEFEEDVKVVKYIYKKISGTNVDVDGDGKPDINIDTDGDGLPDINVDTNGDGKPDINVDTDNTGVWKPSGQGGNGDNIWKPDTNLDTDGDGKADIEHGYRPGYDFDKDGVDDNWKPDINVKPDGNRPGYDTGNPNINVDTNGDGKPDINIDTDGDGVPDVNIDTNGDGIADKNLIGNSESSKIKSDSENGDLGSVKTGDDNNIHFYGIIICVSLLVIFITIRKMKFIK